MQHTDSRATHIEINIRLLIIVRHDPFQIVFYCAIKHSFLLHIQPHVKGDPSSVSYAETGIKDSDDVIGGGGGGGVK